MSQTTFCPGCGKGLPSDLSFCTSCASPLPKPSAGDVPTVRNIAWQEQQRPDPDPPHRWMGAQEPPPRPVTPLSTQPPAYQPPAAQSRLFPCPDCGRMISRMAAFCPQCGSGLRAAPPQPHGIHATHPPQAAAATTLSFSQRSPGEQLLIIVLAVIAACVILAFFC